MRAIFKIRDRHTGETLLQSTAWAEGNLQGAYLGHRHPKDLQSADFRGANLADADFTGRDLSDADLTGAALIGAKFDQFTRWPDGFDPVRAGAVLVPADLKGAKRQNADFSGLDLSGTDFSGADLSGALFHGTNLTRAKFRGTTLNGADLSGADLSDTLFMGIRTDAETRWPDGFDPNRPVTLPAKPETPTLENLTRFLKTLADPNRLRLIGLLAHEELTGEELAAALDLAPATTSHHLARLKELGLICVRKKGTRHLYRLETETLELRLRDLPSETVRIARGGVDEATFDRKVLANYFRDGRLIQIPFRQKKLMVILRHLADEFEVVRQYPEKEVNAILLRFHPDCATLRRNLVDYRFMARANGVYWRTP